MNVLFLGEGDLSGPARYLAAVLRWAGMRFDHCPDESPIPAAWRRKSYDLFLLSDYRASSFSGPSRQWMIDRVQRGTGLLMVGGWASFTGLVGEYANDPLEALLPVTCISGDDRENRSSVLVRPRGLSVPLFNTLNWRAPPVVCGYHRVIVREGSRTLLTFRDLAFKSGKPFLTGPHPALVVGRVGQGRTAALMTDAAPHWAGGLVDWGWPRKTVRLGAGNDVEVGLDFLRFFSQLFGALARDSSTAGVVPSARLK